MDKQLLTPANIMFVLGLIAILFSAYNHFKKPQDESSLTQKEVEGKALLLAQQVQTEKEYNTKKFGELTDRFDNTDRKIETLTESVNEMNLSLSNKLTEVGTIVSEHMKNPEYNEIHIITTES